MNKKSSIKLTRSARLRKYAIVYNAYQRKIEQSKIQKSPRRSRNKSKTTNTSVVKDRISTAKKKHSLNPYQKFVQKESQKYKYRNLSGRARFEAIASEWRKKKNKDRSL